MKLPLTVIGGYLGAGKTTLINRLLAEDHGLRLMIMVNDFGALNVDASLIAAASEDLIALTNGCVCCTMGADLFLAIGDVLDRSDWPDHLVVEASGIADPAAIAQVALAEPDLAYGGIVTVVDAVAFDRLADDPQIGVQLRAQVDVADVVVVSKTAAGAWPARLTGTALDLATVALVAPLICGIAVGQVPDRRASHADYVRWQAAADTVFEKEDLLAHLAARPDGLFRVKGYVAAPRCQVWEVHCVGRQLTVSVGRGPVGLVGIGLQGCVTLPEVDAWWNSGDL
ncbi:CobW family GTP-binding protein [Tateyamaria sp.]|uniref:CobW family GTP-binding protein n=1 Tax=Tateyamaria sp. TaxID=1929288 RepID=UPI003B21BF41